MTRQTNHGGQTDREGHLQYLLTAYLFGDISADGKSEVEAHLAACAACRAEMEELRATAGLLKEAVAPAEGGETEYSFEAHRIERVLAAGNKAPVRRSFLFKLSFGAAAASLLFSIVWMGTVTLSSRGRRPPTSEVAYLAQRVDESAAVRPEVITEKRTYTTRGLQGAARAPAGEPPAAAAPAPAETPASLATVLAAKPAAPAAAAPAPQPADSPAPAERSENEVSRRSRNLQLQRGGGAGGARGAVPAPSTPAAVESKLALKAPAGPEGQAAAVTPTPGKDSYASFDVQTAPNETKPKALRELAKQMQDTMGETFSLDSGVQAAGEADARRSLAELTESRQKRFYESGGAGGLGGNKAAEARKAGKSGGKDLPFNAGSEMPEEKAPITAFVYGLNVERLEEELKSAPKTESNEALGRLGDQLEQSQDRAATRALLESRFNLNGIDFDNFQRTERILEREALDQGLGRGPPIELAKLKKLAEHLDKKTDADGAKAVREDDLLDLAGGYAGDKVAHFDVELQSNTISDGEASVDGLNRRKLYQANPEVIAAHGFQDRDEASYSQLQRLQGKASGEYSEALRQVLDLDGRRGVSLPESPLRGWSYFRRSDPQLTWERYKARPMPVPPPSLDGEGLSPEDFRRRFAVNGFVDTRRDHFSTFGMDVDTASYSLARNALRAGTLPEPKTVRVEEFINSFPSQEPADPERAFSVFCDGGPSPFGIGYDLLLITVKARALREREEKPAVLTFAVDTSGSMNLQSRLDLVRASLSTLVGTLKPEDRVGIVAYNAHAYLVLPHTAAREQSRILGAVGALAPGGASNVEAGLDLAYRVADEVFEPRAVNRVILCSDGVANAGARGPEEILQKVKVYSGRGIYLSTVGFGAARYNDALMETLADRGNGNYSFVDGAAQANEVFKKNLPGTLQVLAQDAKIQVDFDPAVVSHYRLLGYENRDIADKDFRNDKIDAGEVGPGATVSVLYEIRRHPRTPGDLGRIHLRYRDTGTGRVDEHDYPLPPGVLATSVRGSSERCRFIAAVAELAELLRGSYWARDGSFQNVHALLRTLGPAYRARPEVREVFELAQRAQILTMNLLLQR